MATTFYSARGCYYSASGSGGSSWSVSPSIGAGCPILYQGCNIRGVDHVVKNMCFDDIRVAAAIGKGFGTLEARGIALLGPNSCNIGNAVKNWFIGARPSSGGGIAVFSSSCSGSHAFLPTWFHLGAVDTEFNIHSFAIGGDCLD